VGKRSLFSPERKRTIGVPEEDQDREAGHGNYNTEVIN